MSSPIMSTPAVATGSSLTKRERDTESSAVSSSSKRTSPGKDKGKAGQGLRHFSLKVCEKVEEKGTTTYNEVADELVKEFRSRNDDGASEEDECSNKKTKASGGFDEKNIRRRVYDALNVLMAMDIIYKEKKEIRWNGLPTNVHNDVETLQREKAHRLKEIHRKRECLKELLVQHVCYSNLVKRNKEQNASEDQPPEDKISVPFIVVNTSHSTVIQCEMGPDRTDVFFNFSKPFEINDDKEILKRMGMSKMSLDDLRRMLPPDMLAYCQDHRLLETIVDSRNAYNYPYPPPYYPGGPMPPPPRAY